MRKRRPFHKASPSKQSLIKQWPSVIKSSAGSDRQSVFFFFVVRMIKGNLPEERPPKCNPSEEGLQVLSRRIIQVVMIKSVI